MSLLETIQGDLVKAVKAGNSLESDILKIVISNLKNEQIAKGEDLTDEEAMKIVYGESKKVKDSLETYEKAGREELAAREKDQLTVIERYLPAQADDEEITAVVKKVIDDTGASNAGNMGMVMGAAMAELQGKADGKDVSRIVKELLS